MINRRRFRRPLRRVFRRKGYRRRTGFKRSGFVRSDARGLGRGSARAQLSGFRKKPRISFNRRLALCRNATVLTPKYRSIAYTVSNILIPTTFGNQNLNTLSFVNNSFWLASGGGIDPYSGGTIPSPLDNTYLRGGVAGLKFHNDAPVAVSISVWHLRSRPGSGVSITGPNTAAWDPSCNTRWWEGYKIVSNRRFMLNGSTGSLGVNTGIGTVYECEYKIRPQLIHNSDFNAGFMRDYWVVGVQCLDSNATGVQVGVDSWYNLAFSQMAG